MKMTWTHQERRERSSQRDEDDGVAEGTQGPRASCSGAAERRGVRLELVVPGSRGAPLRYTTQSPAGEREEPPEHSSGHAAS